MTSCGANKEKPHKNPAFGRTRPSQARAWSNTIPVFLMKNRNLYFSVKDENIKRKMG